jgi:acyl-CoA-binding protein
MRESASEPARALLVAAARGGVRSGVWTAGCEAVSGRRGAMGRCRSRSPSVDVGKKQRAGKVAMRMAIRSKLSWLVAVLAVGTAGLVEKKGWMDHLPRTTRVVSQAVGVGGAVAASIAWLWSTKRADQGKPLHGKTAQPIVLSPSAAAMSEAEAAAEFARTAEAVRSGGVRLGKPFQEDLLRLYALFKQGTEGDCCTPRPSMLEMAAALKWDAWNEVAGMSLQTARMSYVALVQQLSGQAAEAGEADDDDEAALEAATNMGFGGFGGGGLKGGLSAGGDWYGEDDNTASGEGGGSGDGGTALWALARDGKLAEIDEKLSQGGDGASAAVNAADESARTALYWAADRGHDAVVRCLLQNGADVDAQADDGQTALHCAIVCEFGAVVDLLLEAGASTTIEDEDGETPLTLAQEMLGEEDPISKRVAADAAAMTTAAVSTD